MKEITREAVENNHKEYLKRVKLYEGLGLDTVELRENIIKHIDCNAKNILEIGTGNGLLTCLLAKKFNKVISIDIDEEAQHIAKFNLAYEKLLDNVCFEIKNAEDLNFKDRSFDFVVSAFSFHHFVKPFRVLQEIIRVTNNTLVVTDFNENGFRIVDELHQKEDRHHERKSKDFDIVGVYLRECGFDVVEDEDKWQKIYIAERKINEVKK
jgi:ubiquinone/menaquinone biosynthesis C-methylase UbiE